MEDTKAPSLCKTNTNNAIILTQDTQPQKAISTDPLQVLYTSSKEQLHSMIERACYIITHDPNKKYVLSYTNHDEKQICDAVASINALITKNPSRIAEIMGSSILAICPESLVTAFLAKLGVIFVPGSDIGVLSTGFKGQSWVSVVMQTSRQDSAVAALLSTIAAASPSPLFIFFLFEVLRQDEAKIMYDLYSFL